MPTRFELVIKVLQTFALPLGYGTIFNNDSDGNRTRVTAVKGRCLNLLTTEPNTNGCTLFKEIRKRFLQRLEQGSNLQHRG